MSFGKCGCFSSHSLIAATSLSTASGESGSRNSSRILTDISADGWTRVIWKANARRSIRIYCYGSLVYSQLHYEIISIFLIKFARSVERRIVTKYFYKGVIHFDNHQSTLQLMLLICRTDTYLSFSQNKTVQITNNWKYINFSKI